MKLLQQYEQRPNPFIYCSHAGRWYSKCVEALKFEDGCLKKDRFIRSIDWRHLHDNGTECNFFVRLSKSYFVWEVKRNKGVLFFLNELIIPAITNSRDNSEENA